MLALHRTFDTGSTTDAFIPFDDDPSVSSSVLPRRFDIGDAPEPFIPLDEEDDPVVPVKRAVRTCRRQTPEKRAERMSSCGMPIHFVGSKGQPRRITYRCDLKECSYCGKKRADNLHDRLTRALQDKGALVWTVIPHGDAIDIFHKLACNKTACADDYLRIPQKDETDIVFAVAEIADHLPDTKPFTSKDIKGLNLMVIQNVHDKYSTSGKLGKKNHVTRPDPDRATMGVKYILVEPDDEPAFAEEFIKVVAKTFRLDPHDAKQILSASRLRSDMLIDGLSARGIKYKVFWGRESYNVSCIDWVNDSYDTLYECVDRGLLTQAQLDDFFSTLDPDRLARIIAEHKIEPLEDARYFD